MPSNNRALIIIDMQEGFLESHYWGRRNNPALEENVKCLLTRYRELSLPVVHVQHLSTEPQSPLNPIRPGVAFMDCAKPQNETIITKTVNSAFIGTNLESFLKSQQINNLTLVGLTSDHCVSTSARMAANLGFKVTMSSDATATFDRKGFDGADYPADLVHQVSLASLHKEFVTVMPTHQILHRLAK